MTINIRLADEKDMATIASYQVEMAWETETFKLDLETVTKGVQAVFKNPELGRYYIAEVDDKIVASLLTTYEWSDWRNLKVWWIQSVYVISEFRRKGIFARLYEYIKDKANQDEEVGGIRLYVDKTNTSAQITYQKIGMNGEHYQLFEWMK
ncbi:MAG: GNAT family N-acetyltransferase [Bacteroidales bacterium]|nr:GNAT family N-acetyltransferase [Bacteroidales bacterium]